MVQMFTYGTFLLFLFPSLCFVLLTSTCDAETSNQGQFLSMQWQVTHQAGFNLPHEHLWSYCNDLESLVDLFFVDTIVGYKVLPSSSAAHPIATLTIIKDKESIKVMVVEENVHEYSMVLKVYDISSLNIFTLTSPLTSLPFSVPSSILLRFQVFPYAGQRSTASLLRISAKGVFREQTTPDVNNLLITSFTQTILDAARKQIDAFPCSDQFRTYAGTCNNVKKMKWGASFTSMKHKYIADVHEQMTKLPNVRLVSRELFTQDESVQSKRKISALAVYWGQFIDHDLAITPVLLNENINIHIDDKNDVMYRRHSGLIKFHPSKFANDGRECCGNGISTSYPGNAENRQSSFVDASHVYGTERMRVLELRDFKGGLLRVDNDNLDLPPISLSDNALGQQEIIVGDVRGSEQPLLASLHTLFVREHNRLALKMGKLFSCWKDEQLFQYVRRIIISQVQLITYRDFLPCILGQGAMTAYNGYDEDVNPALDLAFASVTFRFGHSMVPNTLQIMKSPGEAHEMNGTKLSDTFLNLTFLKSVGVEPLLLGASMQVAEQVDLNVVASLQNELFKHFSDGGLDLVAFNLQRARSEGISNYNQLRESLGLARVASFDEMQLENESMRPTLKAVYSGNIDAVDAFVGALAEQHVQGAEVGEVLLTSLKKEFEKLRDGDRFFYKNMQWPVEMQHVEEVQEIIRESVTLKDIITRNSNGKLKDNYFHGNNLFRIGR